jgi:hypothetical protein
LRSLDTGKVSECGARWPVPTRHVAGNADPVDRDLRRPCAVAISDGYRRALRLFPRRDALVQANAGLLPAHRCPAAFRFSSCSCRLADMPLSARRSAAERLEQDRPLMGQPTLERASGALSAFSARRPSKGCWGLSVRQRRRPATPPTSLPREGPPGTGGTGKCRVALRI